MLNNAEPKNTQLNRDQHNKPENSTPVQRQHGPGVGGRGRTETAEQDNNQTDKRA